MSQLVHALEVLDLCAQKMDTLSANNEAREDVRAIYLVAGQALAANQVASVSVQVDPRIPVPDWLIPEEPRLESPKQEAATAAPQPQGGSQ